MKRIAIILACLLLCMGARAQRTADGEMGLSANFVYPFSAGWGGAIGWQMYKIMGFIDVEASVTRRNFNLIYEDEYSRLGTYHLLASGGYMFRLCATRDRRFNLYAGGGALLGYGLSSPNDGDWTLYNTAMGQSRSGQAGYFLFGLYPKLECEFFFADAVALTVSGRAPFTFHPNNTDLQQVTGVVYPEVRAGVKFNF